MGVFGLMAGCTCGPAVVQPTSVGPASETVYERPPPMSPGTLRGLGPHLWEATFDRRGDRQGIHTSRISTARLVWSELDFYEFQDFGEDGALRLEEIRLGDDLYRRTSGEAPFNHLPGTPGDSLVLNKTLGPWKSTLSPFGAQAAFERVGDSTLEGRPVRVYRLGLAPPLSPDLDRVLSPDEAANLSGQAVTPISLTGLVYIDVETGNRLLAEVEGRYVPRRIIGNVDPTDEVLVTFRESRSPTQLRATIEPPDPTRVRRGTRPGLHAPTPRPRGR